MADMVEISVRYDGEQLVLDGPLEFPAGARLKAMLREETKEERIARLKVAIHAFGELGRGGTQPDPRYLDDRETYYDDDHRAGLD